jgi:hypothetical protein
MTKKINWYHAEAIAAALGARLVSSHDEVKEMYVLILKANRRARLSLQYGDIREPTKLFVEPMYPGDTLSNGRRISRHYRVVTEINENGIPAEINASIHGNPARIAVNIERHVVRNYLLVLSKVLPFFPETVAVTAEGWDRGAAPRLAI